MSDLALPPSTYGHVFSVSGSSLIDAPRDKIWPILMDFPSYGQWNTFVRSTTLTDESKTPLPDQTPALGKHAHIKVNMPPKLGEPAGWFSSGTAFVVIDSLDHDNYHVSWSSVIGAPFLLHTKRWQGLTLDENTGKTKYYTIEAFGGLLAYIISFLLGSKLRAGFQAAAESLKHRAEEK